MRNRARQLLAGLVFCALPLAAQSAGNACAARGDCCARFLFNSEEHFGGTSVAAEARAGSSSSCGNGLVFSTPAGNAATSPPALVDAPSFIWENSRQSGGVAGGAPIAPEAAGLLAGNDYTPLTPRQKFNIFLRSTHSRWTFMSAGFDAVLSQFSGDNRGFGGGLEGYGKRYGAALANSESGVFFVHFLFPVMFHQDPRYFRRQTGGVFRRSAYAVSRVFITRTDEGGEAVNSSHIMGRLVSSALSNAYYPENQRGIWPTARRTANALISDAGAYVFKEFWSDFRKRALPAPIQHAADRLSGIGQK